MINVLDTGAQEQRPRHAHRQRHWRIRRHLPDAPGHAGSARHRTSASSTPRRRPSSPCSTVRSTTSGIRTAPGRRARELRREHQLTPRPSTASRATTSSRSTTTPPITTLDAGAGRRHLHDRPGLCQPALAPDVAPEDAFPTDLRRPSAGSPRHQLHRRRLRRLRAATTPRLEQQGRAARSTGTGQRPVRDPARRAHRPGHRPRPHRRPSRLRSGTRTTTTMTGTTARSWRATT